MVPRMPDIDLISFPVVGDKWRDEPWWTSGAAMRLLLSEYAKYVVAEARVRLADLGVKIPELDDMSAINDELRKPAKAAAN